MDIDGIHRAWGQRFRASTSASLARRDSSAQRPVRRGSGPRRTSLRSLHLRTRLQRAIGGSAKTRSFRPAGPSERRFRKPRESVPAADPSRVSRIFGPVRGVVAADESGPECSPGAIRPGLPDAGRFRVPEVPPAHGIARSDKAVGASRKPKTPGSRDAKAIYRLTRAGRGTANFTCAARASRNGPSSWLRRRRVRSRDPARFRRRPSPKRSRARSSPRSPGPSSSPPP